MLWQKKEKWIYLTNVNIFGQQKELLTNYADNEELGLYIVKDVRAPGWWKYKNDVDEVYFNPCSSKVLLTTEWFWENQSSIRLLNDDRIKEKRQKAQNQFI